MSDAAARELELLAKLHKALQVQKEVHNYLNDSEAIGSFRVQIVGGLLGSAVTKELAESVFESREFAKQVQARIDATVEKARFQLITYYFPEKA